MGQLTTHILDLTKGRPAANVRIDVYEAHEESITFLKSSVTNSDGRLDAPLLAEPALHKATYELHVHIGDFFKYANGFPDSPFLDIITIRFNIANVDENYHVPLLVSPFGYQVYRGS
ncbi:hydroxyisourate hydrolase [Sporolactobacillus laevolacticus]|uniref:hydroxyisourate hydrolase n=1 Tax=Sporolactobacillus laevolacticus TaxID=33018 RepID=UPI0025B2BA2F|nr:hydroxyisourate hydrolase [Sporolactobacillus laevolacticus]MDN3956595.1 hydroxyisourate hydrolase [Sporolactobacillus laevolacticus]